MNSTSSDTNDHTFQPASPDTVRSPCPALNSLCAHGYLPRSGRKISFMQLFTAIRAVYNTSFALSLFLTCGGFFLCGHNRRPTIPFFGTIDLHDFALHGGIEHDASLAHADAASGALYAPTTPDHALLEELLSQAGERDSLVLADFARIRSHRESALTLGGRTLDSTHAEITRGEVALILAIIGDGEKVSTRSLREWMGEEKLPDGWQRPERSQGLLETVRMARKVGVAVDKETENLKGDKGTKKGD